LATIGREFDSIREAKVLAANLFKQTTANGDELLHKHPCLYAKAYANYRRIHLPVSPLCNIQCRFCKSGLNKQVKRKSRSVELITPQQALEIVTREVSSATDITVVGIDGPGDPLASSHALDTFRLVHQAFPHLIQCLSTNGLLLRDKVEELLEVGVNSISVSINASNVQTLARICTYVRYDQQYMTGELAANWLLLSQIAGIEKASRKGLFVKINTVLIPGVNDKEIAAIAQVTAQSGAKVMNIIPLVPLRPFTEYRRPTHREVTTARSAAQKYLPVLDCFQCKIGSCSSS
jgi:nitrogen fixation protein NifB